MGLRCFWQYLLIRCVLTNTWKLCWVLMSDKSLQECKRLEGVAFLQGRYWGSGSQMGIRQLAVDQDFKIKDFKHEGFPTV